MLPPSPPKGVSKTQNGRFPSKIALRLKKVCYKVSLCDNCQRQSCKAFIGLTNRAKMIGGETTCTWNFGSKWPRWSKITDFRSLFGCSVSAVRGGGTQKRKVSEIWTISCDNSETVRDRMSVRIRAFHWYQPRWPWIILNGVIAFILCFFSPNLIAL